MAPSPGVFFFSVPSTSSFGCARLETLPSPPAPWRFTWCIIPFHVPIRFGRFSISQILIRLSAPQVLIRASPDSRPFLFSPPFGSLPPPPSLFKGFTLCHTFPCLSPVTLPSAAIFSPGGQPPPCLSRADPPELSFPVTVHRFLFFFPGLFPHCLPVTSPLWLPFPTLFFPTHPNCWL